MKLNTLLKIIIFTFILIGCKNNRQSSKIQPRILEDSIALTTIHWKNKICDLGTLEQDTTITAKYTFYNTGSEKLIIHYVNPDCSCTGFELSKKVIHIKDSAHIYLKLNTKNKIGKQFLYTTVCTNTKTKMYKLTLKAYVKY